MTKKNSLRSSRRGGFTLIELLVVIAIIAVLAAILFPVFAQAKAAAKGSSSLANTVQIGKASLIYSIDYDDCFIIGGQWHSQDPDASMGYSSSPYMPWTGIIQPYLKNLDVLVSPFVTRTSPFAMTAYNYCNNPRQCVLLYPNYGYNVKYLSPTPNASPFLMAGLSQTAVEKLSEQVAFTEIWSRNNAPWGALSAAADFAYMSFASAEAPDGATSYPAFMNWTTPFGMQSWGTYDAGANAAYKTDVEGRYTAGVAFRALGLKTPVLFADGHAKIMGPPELAAGTNWVRGTTLITRNLRNGKYLWDPRGQ